ncbi:hypothetical protein JCM10207_005642 [Rhodosporidiobolus poonsookiae]
MPKSGSGQSASPPPGRGASTGPLGEDDLYEPGGNAKYACTECRRRKLKCTRTVPICEFCAAHNHECKYTKIVRTPLTRKNLDAAEQRISELQELLSRHGRSDSEVQRFAEGGSLPRASPASHHTSLPPVLPTPASMPPPPAEAHAPVLMPQPPVFPMPPSLPPQAPVMPSPGLGSHLSPATIASSSSPVQPYAPIASSSAAGVSLGMLMPDNVSIPGGSPFSSRAHLPTMSTAFPAVTAQSSSSAAQPAQMSTPAESTEEGDGMGALTVEEGATGYLGSLSGAALLHFLQRAADVNLSSAKGKGTGKSVTSPSSTIASQAVPPEQLAAYVESYFRVYHLQYPLVHEASFRAQLAEIIPRPGGSAWQLLYSVILGLGSMCVIGDTEATETLVLYEQAAAGVSAALFEQPTLTAVQAFLLLGNYAQKLNHPSSGSVFLGIALRLAINLGLHCESSARNLSPFEQESRRRVWWCLVAFDSGAQLTFGHPSTLPTAGVDVQPLLCVSDVSFTPAAIVRPPSSDHATAYSSLFYQCLFHQLASQIISFLTTRPNLTAAEALRLCSDIDLLQTSLPAYFFSSQPGWFAFARAKMAWRIENLRLVVLRQVFLKHSLAQAPTMDADEEAWQRTTHCAMEVIKSCAAFTEPEGARSMMEWWYCLHFLFPALWLPLVALRVRPASPAAIDWVVVIQTAKTVLERVKHALLKPLAERGIAIITAVAGLEAKDPAAPPLALDNDFSAFLELLAGTSELDGSTAAATAALPAPGLLADLDQLFNWFTPAGSPQPM